jgi:hypothetical protein
MASICQFGRYGVPGRMVWKALPDEEAQIAAQQRGNNGAPSLIASCCEDRVFHGRPTAWLGISESNFDVQRGAMGVTRRRNPIKLQDIERVGEFLERAVHVRQRQCREPAESLRPLLDHASGEFIAAPCQVTGSRIVSDMDPRGGDRRHCRIDASIVHERQHAGLIP